MKIKNLFNPIAILMLICLPLFSQAQLEDPGGDPDVPVPFDGGISLLVAAGIGYGAKKAYNKKNKVAEVKA